MITIGRHSTCDLRLADKGVSRRHAVIRSGQGRFFVQDQESAIGTYVNGQRVDACELRLGDVIRIGETEFEFHIL
jgi:pSer/pThr/pTyr-binding forkhead associated (FHA) protein